MPQQQPKETSTTIDSDVDKATADHDQTPLPDAPEDKDFDTHMLHIKLMLKIQKILQCKSASSSWCHEVVELIGSGMNMMVMANREIGSNTDERKAKKSLEQRWFSMGAATKAARKDNSAKGQQRKEQQGRKGSSHQGADCH